MKFSSFKFFPFLFLAACADLKIQTPVAQVLPSENVAEQNLEAAFRAEPSRQETISNDASRRPPSFDNENEGRNLLVSSLSYGLNDRLQISGGILDFLEGLQLQGRYQFLGSPRNRGEIGWSGAAHAEVYTASTKKSGDQNGNFGPGGYNWKATADMNSAGAGVSFGYRWAPNLMAFIGSSYNAFEVNSEINQDPTDDGSNAGGHYEEKLNGHSTASGIGLVWGGGSVRLIPAVQWVEYQVEHQHERGFWWSAMLEFGGSK